VICGANFIHLQACHQFILQTRTFWDDALDLVLPSSSETSFLKIITCWNLRAEISHASQSSLVHVFRIRQIPEVRGSTTYWFHQIPEVRRFTTYWCCQIPVILKQIADLRFKVHSAIILPYVRRLANHVKSAVFPHEHFPATKKIFRTEAQSRIRSRIRQF
jgi:hypothetical protein